MPRKCPFVFLALLPVLAGTSAPAVDVELPPGDKEPVLRIDPGGPAAFVTALAFSPDGKTLYAGGWDKVIRVWELNAKGLFEPSRVPPYRVPIGPGLGGAINAIALSPDGRWLAAAGNGTARRTAGFRDAGFVVPSSGALPPPMLRDIGTVYVFNTRDRTVRILRGHQGPVTALRFGPPRGKSPPLLLSVATEEKDGDTAEDMVTARLWDPDKGESLSVLTGLPAKGLGGRLPGVALWQSGGNAKEVRAALALHDGKLRVWNPARKQAQPWQAKDLLHNLAVAHFAGRDRLLTAGFDGDREQSQLALWRVTAEGNLERIRRADIGDGYARALCLLSSGADGTPDLAAILMWIWKPGALHRYRLRIVGLGEGKFGSVVADVPLWEDPEPRQTTVAAALRGEYLAVAGNRNHDVWVYPLRSLLNKEKPVPKILSGEALTFRHASFVRRGKDLGLLLKPDRRQKPGEAPPKPDREQRDWLFDFGKRRLSDDLAGWQTASPPAAGWRARRSGERDIAVYNGEKLVRKITVRQREALSHYALLPPGKALSAPLLAVAAHQNGQPRLGVYDVASGEQIYQFTGHKERIHSLAFAPDGRLLVSAADDGMVCVWSLIDLNKVRGQRGRLPGVAVGSEEGAVKVRLVESDSPVRGKLRPGDILTGLVENGKLRRFDSPHAFYEAIYLLRPGQEVILRRGAPKGKDDVALRVGQAIDERKPLFSLFVAQAEKPADCEWIGWNPIGPYESSSPKADKYLGWHFNTGDARAPTRFSNAEQYRKKYYQKGLLGELVAKGELSRVEVPRLPPPWIGVWVEEGGRVQLRDGRAPVVVHGPQVALKLELHGRPFSTLSALTWQLDGGAETHLELDHPDGIPFRVPVTVSRGEHRFVVTAWTTDAPSQPIRESLTVQYRPFAPQVRHEREGQQLFVKDPDFALQCDIIPQVVGEDVRVTLRHRHGGKEVTSQSRTLARQKAGTDGPLRLEQRLKLLPGNNEVEVIAVNGDAPRDGQEGETSRLLLPVFYVRKANPPQITFKEVVPLTERKDEGPHEVDPSRPVIVRAPVVRLIGSVKAGEELAEAVRDRGTATPASRLAGFQPGERAEFTFAERISLEPGSQTVRFRSRTATSEEAERTLTLEYRPPVPEVSLTHPPVGEIFRGQKERILIPLRGLVQLPKEARAYEVVILVNGKKAAEASHIDEKAGTLSAMVSIEPGDSQIRVKVSNQWGTVDYSKEIPIRYIRPPVLGTPKYVPVAGKPLLNLEVEVHSPTPVRRESVRVEVNGRGSDADEVRIKSGEEGRWIVQLRGLPLDASSRENKIVLRLSNAEAECSSPASFTITSEKVLSPPEAEFLEPRHDAVVSTARVLVRFQVRSVGALERVRLLQEGRPAQLIDLADVRREGPRYEITVQKEVELERGLNRLSIEVVSVSGRLPDSPQLVINYVPPPMRVVLDSMLELRPEGASLAPKRNDRGYLVFPKVASGQVRLRGHVLWTDPGASRRDEYFVLRVFVNGFQQIPVVRRRRAGAAETPFEVQLLLNRTKDNHVTIVLPGQDLAERSECLVDCGQPVTRQRLHVLVLSPHSRPEQIKERVLGAIHSRGAVDRLQAPAFDEVHISAMLTGSKVSPEFIYYRLVLLKEEISRTQVMPRGESKPMNDVLMIYYEGGEAIKEEGNFFETYAQPGSLDRFGMPCDKLVDFLADIPGAHVLLLDVERSVGAAGDRPRDKIVRWQDNYPDARTHVVVLRCARGGGLDRTGKVQLIPVLQKAIPRASRLSELVTLVDKAIAASAGRGLLVFTSYLPTELADLRVGPP